MKRLLFAILTCTASVGLADTIELWDGTVLDGVEVIGAAEGALQYKLGETRKKVALTKIRNFGTGSGTCKILRFVDYIDGKKPVKLLSVRIDEPEKKRIRRPLIRLFTCVKNSRGVYEVTVYQNSRTDDPTNAGELEEVDAADFLNRHFILSRPEGLGYRVEIWREGVLQTAKNFGNDDGALPLDWYRTFKVKSTRTLRVAENVMDDAEVEELEETIEAPKEKGWGIDSVSVLPEVLSTVPRLKVDFSILNPTENETTTPKVAFYYVTQGSDGDKEISSYNLTSKADREVKLVDGKYSGSVEKKLPSNIRLTMLEAQKEAKLKQLIYWRVELIKDDKVVASKEKGGAAKSQLPENWWK